MGGDNQTSSRVGETVVLISFTLVAIMLLTTASAQPVAPNDVGSQGSQRRSFVGGINTAPAFAGNVTLLQMDADTLSQAWQAYYGSVSGNIVLDDAQNATLFSWVAQISGQVYATINATVPTWANVDCFNFSQVLKEESVHNIPVGSPENITETFTLTNSHPSFTIGGRVINSNQCNLSYSSYENEADPGSGGVFNETILFDNTTTNNITLYMAYINENQVGFNGSLFDFQMVVPEDGQNSTTEETTYYFYVELL